MFGIGSRVVFVISNTVAFTSSITFGSQMKIMPVIIIFILCVIT